MHIEPLETRIAPATLTGQVLTYTDIDGDKVTITFTKGTLTGGMFIFNTGGVTGDNSVKQQLQDIDVITAVGIGGADITMKVVKAVGGDGFAAVGRITAAGQNLGKITIKGDLGGMELGSGTAGTLAVKSLTVQSMGVYGSATQASPNLETAIIGSLGAFKVIGDVQDVFIRLPLPGENGKIGSVTIGGSLMGGAANNSGLILASGDIGPVKIGRNLLGGGGNESGKIESRAGSIASVTIGGSIISSLGVHDTFTDTLVHSGQVFAFGTLGPVKVGRDITQGGDVPSVAIHARLGLGSITVGGGMNGRDIVGDSTIGMVKIGKNSDGNITSGGKLDGVTIGGAFVGNIRALNSNDLGPLKIAGNFLGIISAEGGLGNVTIGGSITGQSVIQSGLRDMGAVKVGGDIRRLELASAGGIASIAVGGTWSNRDAVTEDLTSVGDIGSFKVGGNLDFLSGEVGRIGTFEVRGGLVLCSFMVEGIGTAKFGQVFNTTFTSTGDIGAMTVAGSFTGSLVAFSNDIGKLSIGSSFSGSLAAGAVKSVTIKGTQTGSLNIGTLGTVKIGGDLQGAIFGIDAASITIGGSMRSALLASTLTAIEFSGTLKKISIGGDLRGQNFPDGAMLIPTRDYIRAGHIGSVFIGGSVLSGVDERATVITPLQSGFIESAHEIGSITIKGDLRGTVSGNGNVTKALILAGTGLAKGATNLAIGKLTIGGSVERAGIHAGIGGAPLTGLDGNAQIGAVKIGGDWIASSLTAGVRDVDADGFGDADDAIVNTPPGAAADAIVARIASIAIKGVVAGSTTGDRFGFVAQQIGSFKAAGFKAVLTTGTDAPIQLALASGDVTIREV